MSMNKSDNPVTTSIYLILLAIYSQNSDQVLANYAMQVSLAIVALYSAMLVSKILVDLTTLTKKRKNASRN